MATGAQTFGLHETFAEPQVLPPPPVRHALLFFLVALALILHIGTAGWSEIHNGAEGFYAGSAREMLAAGSFVPRNAGQTLPNEPPLLHWWLLGSYSVFGVTPAAARIPIALAFVASVALTFLIGERLGGYWRGFVAGMIHLCSCGAYTWARFVTPEPILGAIVAGAIFCAVAGYQRRQSRRLWFAGFALCAGAAYLTRGAYALFLLLLILAVPVLCFREARLRFRALFHWSAIGAFLVVVAPSLFLLHRRAAAALWNSVWISPFAESAIAAQISDASLSTLLAAHLVWWFPALFLIVPGVLFASRKVIRPHEIAFADLLPLWWVVAGFLSLLINGGHTSDSIFMWSGFALAVASAWDRISPTLRLAGIALVGMTGIAAAAAISAGRLVLPDLARSAFDLDDGTFLTLVGAALAVCCGAAAYLVWHEREKLAITTLLLAMVPIGLGAAESIARNSPDLSFGRVAPFLRSAAAPAAEVLFEGPPEARSSLEFYLEGKFAVVQDEPKSHVAVKRPVFTSEEALQRMAKPEPVYLIIHKDRVPWWQAQLTERFHIYHQVASCGAHVMVNNHQ